VQDSQLLEPHMNLVDQCVQGEGLVQINVELKSEGGIKKINIVDVLKPADDNLRNVGLSLWKGGGRSKGAPTRKLLSLCQCTLYTNFLNINVPNINFACTNAQLKTVQESYSY
jgi:hypothetical protein